MQNTITDFIPVLYRGLDKVAREMVGMTKAVRRDATADSLGVGQVANIPIAPAATVADIVPAATPGEAAGQTLGTVPITVTKSRKAEIGWNGEQMKIFKQTGRFEETLADQFAQAIRAIVNEVEADLAALHLKTCRAYGTANTHPFATANDMSDFAAIRKILEDVGAPSSDLHLVLNSGAMANLRGKMSNLFKANEAGSDSFLRTGALFDVDGMMIHQSAFLKAPAVGTAAGATTTAAGFAKGATVIACAAAGTGTILAGDIITFNGDTTKYVVKTGLASAAAGGNIELQAPGLAYDISAGTKAITVIGQSARNLAFHRDSMLLLARQPAMPDGGDMAEDVYALTDPYSGITFQVAKYKGYRQIKYEVGLAWGVAGIKPEFGAILLGQQ